MVDLKALKEINYPDVNIKLNSNNVEFWNVSINKEDRKFNLWQDALPHQIKMAKLSPLRFLMWLNAKKIDPEKQLLLRFI